MTFFPSCFLIIVYFLTPFQDMAVHLLIIAQVVNKRKYDLLKYVYLCNYLCVH